MEPLGYDRVLDVTVRNGVTKTRWYQFILQQMTFGSDKFAKAICIYYGVKPGVFVSADKIEGAIEKI